MFFLFLCIGLYLLIANQVAIDLYGWLWLVAAGWFLGFLDGRLLWKRKSAEDATNPDATMPPPEEDIPVEMSR